ncbi:Exostosin-like [Trema orientale]|uniref:Exostosin-like n=1 Tax=Trema orientale TaxID=63057 RepID=A0A2P5D7Q8_TREOI|nr:Exostosin-like [Trema orientale]
MKVFGDNTIMPMAIVKGRFWFVVSATFLFWYLLLCFYNSKFTSAKNSLTVLGRNFGHYDNRLEPHNHPVVLPPKTFHENGTLFSEETGDMNNNVTKTESSSTVPRTENWDKPSNTFPIDDNGFASVDRNSASGKVLEPDNNQAQSAIEVRSKGNIDESDKKAVNDTKRLSGENQEGVESDGDSCSGRYIYIHNLPRRFNRDLLKKCRSLSNWTNMCEFTSNSGFGPPLSNSERVYANRGWYSTNQFSLEVIFHNRMKQYECLTNDSSLASAVFVPYYAGLDVARYLWGYNVSMRDSDSLGLVKWLRQKPEWRKMKGRDHFLVAGRITWDFRRLTDEELDWGNKFLFLPESKNMMILTIESSPWHNNDFAIPYPTYFHPSKDGEVFRWQGRMRRQRRPFLFSFAGGQRPNLQDSIRGEIIEQCKASRRKCKLLECHFGSNRCQKPDFVMKMFQSSVFCLQPPGDSSTRRSAFDSILAGCIPVFFHPGSAYIQYLWHLPRNFTKYSVYIPDIDVKKGTVSIEKTLLRIPKQRVAAMREEVIRLIPKVIYAGSKLNTLDDAFDISIKGVLERVSKIRREMEEGKDSSLDYAEELSWKYNFFGTVREHEWDRYFERT